MPTPDQIRAAVHGYVAAFDAGDPELAVALFASDATVEDPVGTPLKEGTEAIRDFYTNSMATGAKLHLQGPIRIGPDYAAFAFQARLTMDGKTMTVDSIDVFRFNSDSKVVRMEAYFGPGNFGTAD